MKLKRVRNLALVKLGGHKRASRDPGPVRQYYCEEDGDPLDKWPVEVQIMREFRGR